MSYYFILRKNYGSKECFVDLYMYRKRKKFWVSFRRNERTCFNFFVAHWYWLLFNLPAWVSRNGERFGYPITQGRIVMLRE